MTKQELIDLIEARFPKWEIDDSRAAELRVSRTNASIDLDVSVVFDLDEDDCVADTSEVVNDSGNITTSSAARELLEALKEAETIEYLPQ